MSALSCKSCKHYRETTEELIMSFSSGLVDRKIVVVRECLRFPQGRDGLFRTVVNVQPDDYCGEFRMKHKGDNNGIPRMVFGTSQEVSAGCVEHTC